MNRDYGTDLSGLPSGGPSSYGRIKAERIARAERLEEEARRCQLTDPYLAAKLNARAERERSHYGYTM